MNITIVKYRANGIDTCRGCLVGSSDSDHEIYVTDDEDDAARSIAEKLFEDRNSNSEFCNWEITILFNGLDSNSEFYNDNFEHIINKLAHEKLTEMIQREKELAKREEAKKAEQREIDKFVKERLTVADELAQLAALKLKYEK